MDPRDINPARRRFLLAAGTLAAAASLGPMRSAWAGEPGPGKATLTLTSGPGIPVSERLIGLSYETLQMHNPEFFSRNNGPLIGLLRRLNPQGVLRLGGCTSDYSAWSEYRGVLPPFPQLPNAVFKRPYMVTPQQLANLADFLDATGWRLIFGVNLGRDLPEMAAQQAEAVQRAVGERLLAIQIGNEPNGFKDAQGHALTFDAYFARWQRSADAIRRRVKVPLAGPDTGANTDWVLRFAERVPDAVLLSRHYYRGGAPEPTTSIGQLLSGDPAFFAELPQVRQAAARHNTPFVLTEVNSYWGGGKLGVSNTLASALWGGDFALACAQAGVEALNIHGGVLSILEASLDKKRRCFITRQWFLAAAAGCHQRALHADCGRLWRRFLRTSVVLRTIAGAAVRRCPIPARHLGSWRHQLDGLRRGSEGAASVGVVQQGHAARCRGDNPVGCRGDAREDLAAARRFAGRCARR